MLFSSQKAFADLSQNDALLREKSLMAASTNTDSIKILLDVYNLSDKNYRNKVRKQLINLASQSSNHELIGDVINELASSTDDTKDLNRLIIMSENLPEEEGKETLQTVLQMEQAKSEAHTIVDSQLKEQLAEYKRQGISFTGDPYKEIQNIFRTMVYLGASSQGPMYFECIKRLEGLVENLPEKDYAIKNLFYTNAALFYTRNKDYAKAIEFDRKLIDQLNHMRALYQKQGKNVHDLDYFYYVSYRRMLRNFRGLTPEELEDVWEKCVELAQINDEAAEAFGNGGLAKSYYYYAKGEYKEAAPELKKALADPDISDFRKQELLGLLAYSLRQTGDKEGELKALREYSQMAIDDRTHRREDMYRELELRNSVNQVLADELKQQEQQREQNRVMRKTSITLVYVLAVILIFLCGAYFRLRNKAKELEIKNGKLRRNIEYIFDDGVPKGSKDLRHQKNRLKG
ncbi:MAG: hypothetical protein J1F67_07935 [Muribaculaceae bacterium]|nr:hypothetical protein [Muribaculaceae bacterium]